MPCRPADANATRFLWAIYFGIRRGSPPLRCRRTSQATHAGRKIATRFASAQQRHGTKRPVTSARDPSMSCIGHARLRRRSSSNHPKIRTTRRRDNEPPHSSSAAGGIARIARSRFFYFGNSRQKPPLSADAIPIGASSRANGRKSRIRLGRRVPPSNPQTAPAAFNPLIRRNR